MEGSSPWAPCLTPLGWCTCQALPLPEALAQVKAAMAFPTCDSPLQLFPLKLGLSQRLPYWKEDVPCQGNPPDSKSARLLLFTLRVDKELRGNRRRKWGERNRSLGRALHQGVPGCRGSGSALERCSRYMASFSLWEHRLSFISVSWIYRITLVSVRRETHLREQLVRGTLGSTENQTKAVSADPGQARLTQPRSSMAERASRTWFPSFTAPRGQVPVTQRTDAKERRGRGLSPLIPMEQQTPVVLSQHS